MGLMVLSSYIQFAEGIYYAIFTLLKGNICAKMQSVAKLIH
jgi:hypothetical protein